MGGSLSNSMKVVALTAEMADIKVKLRCSQEQFVDMLQKYYTQQLVQLEDPDAVPDWVMLSFRNELSQIFKDFKGYPKITQGQWIRILKTALQDAQDGWPSECIPLPQPAQPAQPAKSDTFDATLSKFQDMEKELNAQPDHEVMEVAKDSQVLDSQPMGSDDEAPSDTPFGPQELADDSQVLDSQPMSSDDSASDPSSDAEPKSKKAKTEEP